MSLTAASQRKTLQDPRTGMLKSAGRSMRNLGQSARDLGKGALNSASSKLNAGFHKDAGNSQSEVKSYKKLKTIIDAFETRTATLQKHIESIGTDIEKLTEDGPTAEEYADKLRNHHLDLQAHTDKQQIPLGDIIELFPEIAKKHNIINDEHNEYDEFTLTVPCMRFKKDVVRKLISIGIIEDNNRDVAKYIHKHAVDNYIPQKRPRLEHLTAQWKRITTDIDSDI